MIPAIKKWMLMICAIIWTKILKFLRLQLPILDPTPDSPADMPDWSDMSQEDHTKAFETLPRPFPGPVPPCFFIHEAIQARHTIERTCAFMMCVGYWVVWTAYDTCAGRCVGYAAVGFEPSKSSGRTAGWRLLGAVHVPSSVGALRCADSERRRWWATHTLTRRSGVCLAGR
jgi:hypothetical protein